MELKDLIQIGIDRKKSITELAEHLGVVRESLSAAKAHKRGLPDDVLSKLSDLIGVDYRTLVAASKLVTEQNEEKRAYWLPFVANAPNLKQMAKFVLILGIVTNFVTPHPAEAAPVANQGPERLCIM